MAASDAKLPHPDEIADRISSCRDEISALQKLYRACKAAHQADEARDKRRQQPKETKDGSK